MCAYIQVVVKEQVRRDRKKEVRTRYCSARGASRVTSLRIDSRCLS